MSAITLERAVPADYEALFALFVRSKSHWGYPDEWMAIFQRELDFSPDYIAQHAVYKALLDETLAGFVGVILEGETADLDLVWVDPPYMGHGVGRAMVDFAERLALDAGASIMTTTADPHAESFYQKCGFVTIGALPSSIAGRTLPRMRKPLRS